VVKIPLLKAGLDSGNVGLISGGKRGGEILRANGGEGNEQKQVRKGDHPKRENKINLRRRN